MTAAADGRGKPGPARTAQGGDSKEAHHPSAKAMGVMVPTPCDLRVTCGGCTAQGSRGAAALTQIFGGVRGEGAPLSLGDRSCEAGEGGYPH